MVLLFIPQSCIILPLLKIDADVAQSVEHILGKDEVPGSNPGISSIMKPLSRNGLGVFGCAHLCLCYALMLLKWRLFHKNNHIFTKQSCENRCIVCVSWPSPYHVVYHMRMTYHRTYP